MYQREIIEELVNFVLERDGIADKGLLSAQVQERFHLVKDRSVFYGPWYAIRFSKAASPNFSNTVLSLSALQKYDGVPFFVCVVTSEKNYLMLSNTTFLRKISHSSQALRIDNIKGSFNGSDIMRIFEGITNAPEHFELLFSIHENHFFEENLARLVEATNNISPTGKKFTPSEAQADCIRAAVDRAAAFLKSPEYLILDEDLGSRVREVQSEIAIAAFIDNINIRGRIIEYLITAEENLKKTLIECLKEKKPLPKIFTADDLGDYQRKFPSYWTETDIKTKILFLSSNPKGYNVDKLLEFLSEEKSVYLVYVVAIDEKRNISTRLCSLFNRQLLSGTRITKHWSGRNSRGEAQYDGRALEQIVESFDASIDVDAAREFLDSCLQM